MIWGYQQEGNSLHGPQDETACRSRPPSTPPRQPVFHPFIPTPGRVGVLPHEHNDCMRLPQPLTVRHPPTPSTFVHSQPTP
jgi:hypothetical protein